MKGDTGAHEKDGTSVLPVHEVEGSNAATMSGGVSQVGGEQNHTTRYTDGPVELPDNSNHYP
jgi:hypothetical protein